MSAIAAEVGGSKSTFWSAFPSKEALFAAVLDDLVGEFCAQLNSVIDRDDDLQPMLFNYARAMLSKLLSDSALRLRRLIYAEVERFPEIGRLFYERGPEQTLRRIATYLAEQMAANQLRAADPLTAAAHFVSLVQGASYQRAVLKVGPAPGPSELDEIAGSAVETFLRAYAADRHEQRRPRIASI